ncbi:hypothetical protein RRSWK_05045 [Rhodopirellula sp. SWK7]|nr:hypothetical protein RRSWK_05045 [Rhodopirellula sp. SWK7]
MNRGLTLENQGKGCLAVEHFFTSDAQTQGICRTNRAKHGPADQARHRSDPSDPTSNGDSKTQV